jgi:ribosomal protein L7/L12
MKLTVSYNEAANQVADKFNVPAECVVIEGVTPNRSNLLAPDGTSMFVDSESVKESLAAMLSEIRRVTPLGMWTNKIALIKAVRNLTGMGPTDAKNFVEKYV